jgi:spectinomycin phosphotransferase
VREPPPRVLDGDVLAVVRERWLPAADAVQHLPVGFGAWHWQVRAGGEARLFVTLDQVGGHHTATSLEAAYAGAAELQAAGLSFVVPALAGPDGRHTTALGDGSLSAAEWRDGTSGDGSFRDAAEAARTAALLTSLHAADPPAGIPRWRPVVGPGLSAHLTEQTQAPWDRGPYGEQARAALGDRLADVASWVERYLALAGGTDPTTWVATHGEPHTRNQLRTVDGRTLLVDWESLKLAPAERDLRFLVEQGHGSSCGADPSLVEMFDLEWRLDEVAQYAEWFQAPHAGTESDRVALGGLLHELNRPPGRTS